MNKFAPKKRKLALWTESFPDQHKALRPESGLAGGIKARSTSEKIRMEIYVPISLLYKIANPYCECCEIIGAGNTGRIYREKTVHIHHTKGRAGNLLFDVRWWKGTCERCHIWIDANRKQAVELGLLFMNGEWNKEQI